MNSDEKLCMKVLKILQEMLIRNMDFDEKVRILDINLVLSVVCFFLIVIDCVFVL